MKKRNLIAIGVAGIVAAGLNVLPEVTAVSGSDYGSIDRYVQAQIQDAHIPGLALGIVHNGEVAHVRGFGTADRTGRPVGAATPFFIGSLSKSFTALAVMQLVDAGKIDLQSPVRRYLPSFRVSDEAASDRITVRELLNQTSGIPTATGVAPLSQPVTTLDDQVRSLRDVSLSARPGQRYQYSNANYEVLGRLVEAVSGQSYGAYLQQRIFSPLDMRHSYVSLAAARADGLASAAPLWFGIPQWHDQGAGFRSDTVPAGYVISSAEDMTHYMIAQLNGGRYGDTSVVSPAGMAQLHAGTSAAGLSALNGSYAMGWFSGPRGKIAQTVWHNGSAAGMHTMLVMVPAKGYGVVVLTNSESALYEFLARTDVIADNVASTLVGQQLEGTLAGLYIGFDIAALLIIALSIRKLVRLITRGPRRYTGRLARTRTVALNWVVPIWREFWVPIAIIVGLPLITGAPWSGNLVTTDLGQWLLLLAALLLATGITRVIRPLRQRREHQSPGQTGGTGLPAISTVPSGPGLLSASAGTGPRQPFPLPR